MASPLAWVCGHGSPHWTGRPAGRPGPVRLGESQATTAHPLLIWAAEPLAVSKAGGCLWLLGTGLTWAAWQVDVGEGHRAQSQVWRPGLGLQVTEVGRERPASLHAEPRVARLPAAGEGGEADDCSPGVPPISVGVQRGIAKSPSLTPLIPA